MEDRLTDLESNINEIISCLRTLQVAVQAEHEKITFQNIDDCLEIALEKLEKFITIFRDVSDEIVKKFEE